MKKINRTKIAILISIMIAFLILYCYFTYKPSTTSNDSYIKVTFLDVGQGDAAIIECDNDYMIIDGGDREASSILYTYLKENSITHFKYVVATHSDADHIGGLNGAFAYATSDMTLYTINTEGDSRTSKKFIENAETRGGGITIPSVGDMYSLGTAEIQILAINSGEENDSSIVLKITFNNVSFLFTGDIEEAGETALLNSKLDLHADVLKVAHHGSSTSTCQEFLEAVDPTYAVISCGKDNEYGHPHESILNRLEANGITVYRTDRNGDIIVYSDGSMIDIKTEQ